MNDKKTSDSLTTETDILEFYTALASKMDYSTEKRDAFIHKLMSNNLRINYHSCQEIVSQAENQPCIDFKATALIISDRLLGTALGLQYFFKLRTGINALGIATSLSDAQAIIGDESIHYLIIAGYLSDEASYEIIQQLRQSPNPPSTIMWANIDSCIFQHCEDNRIFLLFERYKPLADFMEYLDYVRSHGYEHEQQLMYKRP